MKFVVVVLGFVLSFVSPSVWRVWIEIGRRLPDGSVIFKSPSVWRVWIEIHEKKEAYAFLQSPSVWRVWIEISQLAHAPPGQHGHPPCGGCGLKYIDRLARWAESIVTLRVEGVD